MYVTIIFTIYLVHKGYRDKLQINTALRFIFLRNTVMIVYYNIAIYN